jgi:putative ABC transport system ATP-binding protein
LMKPAVLLADEPTGNLDTVNGRHVLELLIRLNKEEGATLVLVTHDEMLASHAERRIILRDGKIVGM